MTNPEHVQAYLDKLSNERDAVRRLERRWDDFVRDALIPVLVDFPGLEYRPSSSASMWVERAEWCAHRKLLITVNQPIPEDPERLTMDRRADWDTEVEDLYVGTFDGFPVQELRAALEWVLAEPVDGAQVEVGEDVSF